MCWAQKPHRGSCATSLSPSSPHVPLIHPSFSQPGAADKAGLDLPAAGTSRAGFRPQPRMRQELLHLWWEPSATHDTALSEILPMEWVLSSEFHSRAVWTKLPTMTWIRLSTPRSLKHLPKLILWCLTMNAAFVSLEHPFHQTNGNYRLILLLGGVRYL